jgi:hypothetical protein
MARGTPSGEGARYGLGGASRAVAEPAGDARGAQRLQVRLAREGRIERFELPGRVKKQRYRLPAAPQVQGDLPVHALEHGLVEVIQRAGRRGGQKCQGLVGRSGQLLVPRGIERAPRAAAPVGCQCRGAFQERGRHGQPAARLGPPGRALQLLGDVLVGRERRVGAVPGTAVGIAFGIGDHGQGQMRALAFFRRRGAIDRRTQQRVAEGNLRADLKQAVGLRGAHGLGRDTQHPGRPPQQRRLAGRLGRGYQQQPLGRGGQLLHAPPEAGFDPARQRAGKAEPPGQFGRRQFMRQLDEGQRVAARLGEDPIPHAVIEWPADSRREQLASGVIRQARKRQIGQPGQLVELARLALGEQQHYRLRVQAPRHEREHLGRGPVQPLGIIDQAQQRPLLGGVGEQAEHRQADQEPVGLRPRTHPERRPERVALRRRQPPEAAQHRPAQLMQAGKGKLHLRLDPGRPGDPKAPGALGRVTQQRCLSDSRFAAQDQHRALPGPRIREQPVQPGAEGTAARQRLRSFETVGSHVLDRPRLPAGEHGDDQYFARTR